MRKSLPKRAVLSYPGDESLGSAREREYLRCARSCPIGADTRAGAAGYADENFHRAAAHPKK
jgi:hypothetical protein